MVLFKIMEKDRFSAAALELGFLHAHINLIARLSIGGWLSLGKGEFR